MFIFFPLMSLSCPFSQYLSIVAHPHLFSHTCFLSVLGTLMSPSLSFSHSLSLICMCLSLALLPHILLTPPPFSSSSFLPS
ncbi:hypothetical protein FKM82_000750 [Ascaphus truei]